MQIAVIFKFRLAAVPLRTKKIIHICNNSKYVTFVFVVVPLDLIARQLRARVVVGPGKIVTERFRSHLKSCAECPEFSENFTP